MSKFIDDEAALSGAEDSGDETYIDEQPNSEDEAFIDDTEQDTEHVMEHDTEHQQQDAEFDEADFVSFVNDRIKQDSEYLEYTIKDIIEDYKAALIQLDIDVVLSKEDRKRMRYLLENLKVPEQVDEEEEQVDEEVKGKRKSPFNIDAVTKRSRLDTIVKQLKISEPDVESHLELKDYQQRVVDALEKQRGLIVYHDVGLGKTYIAIMVMKQLLEQEKVSKVVVVCPQKVIPKFSRECVQYITQYKDQIYFMTLRGCQQIAQEEPEFFRDCLLIVDEAHRAKSYQIQKKRSQASLLRTVAALSKKLLLLTATGVESDLNELRNLIHMLAASENNTDKTEIPSLNKNNELLTCNLSYVTSDDIQSTKPNVVEDILGLPLSQDDWNEYKDMESKYAVKYKLDGKDIRSETAFYTDVRKLLLEAKFNGIVKFIQTHYKNSRIVVFNTYVEGGIYNIDRYLKKFPDIEYGIITGSTSQEEAQRFIQEYNDGTLNLLLISKASSEGVELRNTDICLIAEQNWLFTEDQQLFGRVIRSTTHNDKQDATIKVIHVMALGPQKETCIDRFMYDRKALHRKHFQDVIEPVLRQYSIEMVSDCEPIIKLIERKSKRMYHSSKEEPNAQIDWMKRFHLISGKDDELFKELQEEAEKYINCF